MKDPLPSDFPTYQDYLDHHHFRRSESQQRLQAALEIELSLSEVGEMLALAAGYGHLDEFEQLVSRYIRTIDPNKRLRNGDSPFFLACEMNSVDSMTLLYAQGADLEALNSSGRTPLGVTSSYSPAHNWLLEHGANPNSSGAGHVLWSAALDGDLHSVIRYVKLGAVLDRAEESGRTPLWTACNRRRTACVEYLLQQGADSNWADCDGRVPLMLKVSLKIARMLIEYGAETHRVDALGRSIFEVQSHRPELCQLIKSLSPPDVQERIAQAKAERIRSLSRPAEKSRGSFRVVPQTIRPSG